VKITTDSNLIEARVSYRREKRLFKCFIAGVCGLLMAGAIHAESFSDLEAVDANGVSTWNGSFPITLVGVLLCDPGEMLDSTPDFLPWNNGANAFNLGGQWQVFVQALGGSDRGGVECWMAQNYGNLPWEPHDGSDSYDNIAWSNEIYRVSHDPATGQALHKGDLVMITAKGSLFYGGMQNVNEEHNTDPDYDFTISLVSSNFGLPMPQVISLSSVISTNLSATGYYDVFDPTRATGGEYYQGMRVRINGLTLADSGGWNTNSDWSLRYCTATDGEGRQLPLIHPLYDLCAAPTGQFDAIGVFIQESGSGTDGTYGYELFVQEIAPSSAAVLNVASRPVITWPASLANYEVQCSDSLDNPNWMAVTNSPAFVDGQNTIVPAPGAAQKFFRLHCIR
jgi:hypothetical protein